MRADDHPNAIRVLNDNFRSTFVGGQVVMTQSVSELPLDVKARVIMTVRSFDQFTNENDPHCEHDFGIFEIDGEFYFFKVDIVLQALPIDGKIVLRPPKADDNAPRETNDRRKSRS